MTKMRWLSCLLLLAMLVSVAPISAQVPDDPLAGEMTAPVLSAADKPQELEASQPRTSQRLIVELTSPPLVEWARTMTSIQSTGGQLNVQSATAQMYVARLETEQAAFRRTMQAVLPRATVSTFINELGMHEMADYQILLNGMAVEAGDMDPAAARRVLEQLPGVKHVYLDYAYTPQVYTSTQLINAPVVWNQMGGQSGAGAGVKVASMDGGLHHEAPMFDGTGFSYPSDFPAGGLGLKANNNGKIIASRVYFRTWDPPAPGEENPWPGTSGTPHGTHTGSTAAGNVVTDATYLGTVLPTLSGVAPGAWLMSYRVFYNSVTNDASFYTVEGLAALEDIVADGADVLNNSWGGGPGSLGGEFDVLDQALLNAADAGIFVSMSAGNAGPGLGTTDHPSDGYISVAASSTSGTYVAGRFGVVAPGPVAPALQDLAFVSAAFGPPLAPGQVLTYTYLASANVDSGNVTGCSPWPADTFAGHAALIQRGGCEFSVKVYYAQEAGAEFVVIYNNDGDDLINMGAGTNAELVTVPSIFIGETDGTAMAAKQADAATAGVDAVVELDTVASQVGNVPDVIADFSSRGPGVGGVLKPDIAAPGINIMAQGYDPLATGEARHLGFGQASGTSMAAPHVAGAGALLRALHPDWSPAYIKSALMSTAKYIDIYNTDGSPAQPLDMGAGRVDLSKATDPGVILDSPYLSFGNVVTGTTDTLKVRVTNITDAAETYELSTLYTGDSFAATTELPGFTVEPVSMTLAAGASAMITVTFDSADGMGIGDNQGYVILDGEKHDAHMPAWARVVAQPAEADVLIIGSDFSYLVGIPDYLSYYTTALDELGLTYDFWNADYYFDNPITIPSAAELMAYDTILLFTGDHYEPDGYYPVSTPFTMLDQDILTEYANAGGSIIAMGQDLASVLGSTSFFYGAVLGGSWLQDSVTDDRLPDRRIVPYDGAPAAFHGLDVDVGGLELNEVVLAGFNEVPPVATAAGGTVTYAYNRNNNIFEYEVSLSVGASTDVTATHIHSGPVGVNGPPLVSVFPFATTQTVTDTLVWQGFITFTQEMLDLYVAGDLYVNIQTAANPAGEVRAQLEPYFVGDGASNQVFIDEIATQPGESPDEPDGYLGYTPLLVYPGIHNREDGVVAMAHADQPTLERPGITYLGRSIYTAFGLEGVNDGLNATERAMLLSHFLAWAADTPQVSISNVTPANASGLTMFEADLSSNIETHGVSYRWDFGDGSSYTNPYPGPDASHTYSRCGTYTVRVEAVDHWGHHVVESAEVEVSTCLQRLIYLPIITTP